MKHIYEIRVNLDQQYLLIFDNRLNYIAAMRKYFPSSGAMKLKKKVFNCILYNVINDSF